MGVELELGLLLVLSIVGSSTFTAFEVETPAWRKILKWTLLTLLTLGAYVRFGHIAMAIPLTAGLAGLTVHVIWCRRHGIDSLRARPRRRYYELRGWTWPGERDPDVSGTTAPR